MLQSKLKEGLTKAWRRATERETDKLDAQIDNSNGSQSSSSTVAKLRTEQVLEGQLSNSSSKPTSSTEENSCYDLVARHAYMVGPGQTEVVMISL